MGSVLSWSPSFLISLTSMKFPQFLLLLVLFGPGYHLQAQQKARNLREVEISGGRQPFAGVSSMAWLENRLLVSSFNGSRNLFQLRENYGEFALVALFRDTLDTEELITDGKKRVFAKAGEFVRQISLVDDSLIIGDAIPLKDFNFFNNRFRLANDTTQLNSYVYAQGRGVVFTVGLPDKGERFLYASLDSAGYKTVRSLQAKANALAMLGVDPNTGEDRNNSMGDIGLPQLNVVRARYASKMLYRAVVNHRYYIPSFDVDGQWWLFDHAQGQAVKFRPGEKQPSAVSAIDYQRQEDWSEQMVQSVNGELFLVFKGRDGKTTLKHFNVFQRRPDAFTFVLEHPFPENILVANQSVIYRYKQGTNHYKMAIEPLHRSLSLR